LIHFFPFWQRPNLNKGHKISLGSLGPSSISSSAFYKLFAVLNNEFINASSSSSFFFNFLFSNSSASNFSYAYF
jgi:hypothetical protein